MTARRLSPTRIQNVVPAFIGLAFLLFCTIFPGFRTGDGSEYYAMFFSWRDTLRPYVTFVAWESYSSFSTKFPDLQAPDVLQKGFSPLSHVGQQDFNHFWLYSLIAAIPAWTLRLFGFSISPPTAFGIVHAALITMLFFYSLRAFGWHGVVAATGVILLSPALWFTNKVHTELFTIVLTTVAFASLWRRSFLISSLFFAIAGTQNPSISAVAVAILSRWFYEVYRQRASFVELICFALIVLAFAVHPAYYFFRYGTLTPQLYFVGADLQSASSSRALIFIFNPDIGLIPNWPLGGATIIASLSVLYSYRGRILQSLKNHAAFCFAAILFVALNLHAQSTTININSGGTHHIARYALWYLCLFFVPLTLLAKIVAKHVHKKGIKAGVVLLFLSFAAVNFAMYSPNKQEVYSRPSPASNLLWKYVPGFYDPPLEIFLERMGGIEGTVIAESNVIVGVDCRTIAFRNVDSRSGKVRQPHCPLRLDSSKLLGLLATINTTTSQRISRKEDKTYGKWYMIRLTESELKSSIAHIDCTGVTDFSNKESPASVFMQGFSIPEDHGRWTDGKDASFRCSVPLDKVKKPSVVRIRTTGFVYSNHSQRALISINESKPVEYRYEAGKAIRVIELPLPNVSTGEIRINFFLPDAVSPKELGMNQDTRKIGISVQSIQFE